MTHAYRYTPAHEIAWLVVNKDKFGGKAAKALESLRKNPKSYVKLEEIKDKKDPQAAYDALPNGTPFTHEGKILRKGQKSTQVPVQHPDGRAGTIPSHQLRDALAKGYTISGHEAGAAEHRQYQGKTYRLRPGADRRHPGNWDVVG